MTELAMMNSDTIFSLLCGVSLPVLAAVGLMPA